MSGLISVLIMYTHQGDMMHNQVFEGHHNEENNICVDLCSTAVGKVDILINNKAVHLKAKLT